MHVVCISPRVYWNASSAHVGRMRLNRQSLKGSCGSIRRSLRARLEGAIFRGSAIFDGATFKGTFGEAIFEKDAGFHGATFRGPCEVQ